MSSGRRSLADALVRKGLTRGKAEDAVTAILDGLHAALADGRPALIRGFGSFHFRESHRTLMWDPRTGGRRNLDGGRLLRFRPSQSFLANGRRDT
jgi:nucleoid DNA-binding protein